MLGNKSSQKSAKTLFLYSHEFRDQKMGGKRAKQFSRNKRIVRAKNVMKKIVGKKREKRFLYSHEYRDQKIGGTKRAKQFIQKHTISAIKKCWEKIVGKTCEKRFFIITRIS